MKIQNTLIDNSTEQLSMSTILKECLRKEGLKEIKIATGYWDIPGLTLIAEELQQFLEREDTKIQLVIGQELLVYANTTIKPTIKADFPGEFMRQDLDKLKPKPEYEKAVELLLTYCNMGKWEIRYYKHDSEGVPQFLHSKCYIFNGVEEGQKFAYAIVGSSNLTENGLHNTSKSKGNRELNYVESDKRIVNFKDADDPSTKGHNQWFDEIWQQAEPWTEQYLEQVLKPSPIGVDVTAKIDPLPDSLTPYEAYIRLLQDRFGSLASTDAKAVLNTYLPSEIDRYEYQLDAAALCYQIMHQHGGFMLGDVVGLGKTIVGILIIKYYLDFAEEENRDKKVLIIVPPAIKSSWVSTIDLFDTNREDKIKPYIDFITTGSIDKMIDDEEDEASGSFEGELKKESYGFIVIDESHNFRNNGTQMYESLDTLISQIGIAKGYYPYIGLLSATPQNNSPQDLRNQIYLFQRTPQESSINVEGHNLDRFFADAQRRYETIIKHRPTGASEIATDKEDLRFLMKQIHDNVLSEILVRRTRADIRDGYHANIKFPEIIGPSNLNYKLGHKLAKLFNDTMDIIAPDPILKSQLFPEAYIHYFRYAATKYLANDNLKKPYSGRNMDPDKSSEALARIMQILLVKRLESSFSAFKLSLRNLQRYTDNMITMWENDCIFICPQIDVNAELDLKRKQEKYGSEYTIENCFDDIRRKIKKLTKSGRNEKKQNAEYHRSDFDPIYIDLIMQDKALIDQLVDRWSREKQDPKLREFKASLDEVLFDEDDNRPQKLVIFSEAIDTVEELAKVAESTDKPHNVLLITAKNRDAMEQTIRENFDANYKGEWKNDYDIIITTEVLAEGVNLHRANTILNYDTPWNSTRLIQRIGRVNRIGSKEDYVFVYNFYPSDEGDEEINLVQRARVKLQSFHTLFGEDSKIFSEEEELEKLDFKKMIDGTQSEYTPYILELQEYKKNNAVRLEQIKRYDSPITIALHGNKYRAACVVKTDGNRANSHYFLLTDDGRAKAFSCLEMLELCKCTPDTEPLEFSDYENIEKEALRAYNAYAAKIFRSGNNPTRDKAKEIIRRLSDRTQGDTRKLVNLASRLIDKGHTAVAKLIIKIDEEIGGQQMSAFELDIDDVIQHKLADISKINVSKFGEPYIYSAIQTK